MNNIDKKEAFRLYLKEIEKLDNKGLFREIKYLFNKLSQKQIELLLEHKKIDYLSECGIDEEKLYKMIESIDEGEYYLTELVEEYSYDYDYTYGDPFNICPTLQDAIEYCYTLNRKGDYDKALDIGKKILSLDIEVKSYTEYCDIDEYDESECIDIETCFSCLSYKVNISEFKLLLFAIIIQRDYSFSDISWILDKFSQFTKSIDDFKVFIYDKNQYNQNIRQYLNDSFNDLQINLNILVLLLEYLDDEALFERYAYKRTPVLPYMFEKYYDYMSKKGYDTSKIVIDALSLLELNDLGRFTELAYNLDSLNDDQKILLYKAKQTNENFFNLYSMNDLTTIKSLVNNDFHRALYSLSKKDIFKLSLAAHVELLELLSNKFGDDKYDNKALVNIEKWRNNKKIDNFDEIYSNAINLFNDECKHILGINRDLYFYLARMLYQLDKIKDFKSNLKNIYLEKYGKYRAFKQSIYSFYKE